MQAEVVLTAPENVHSVLATLGDELKFVMLVSQIELRLGDELSAQVKATESPKCERCWHYTDSVGTVAGHETVCARCVDNIEGQGEQRDYA